MQVRLPTNVKAARFDSVEHTDILRTVQADIEGIRFQTASGTRIELPVKLKVHESVFVPIAKWSMLIAGNYRCVQAAGVRLIRDILGKPAYATKNAPASTLTTGDFSQSVVGIFGPGSVRIDIDASQDFNSAGLVARVMLMVDVAFPQPARLPSPRRSPDHADHSIDRTPAASLERLHKQVPRGPDAQQECATADSSREGIRKLVRESAGRPTGPASDL